MSNRDSSDPMTNDPCRGPRYERRAVPEVKAQLRSMHDAVEGEGALVLKGRKAFWCQYWEFQVLHAADREYANRDYERWGRFFALILVLGVTALTSLSVFATGTWATGLGVVSAVVAWFAAIATGALGIFRFEDRWSAYNAVRTGLLAAGWKYVNATSAENADREQAWTQFLNDTQAVMATYQQEYKSLLRKPENGNNGSQAL